MPPPPPPPPGMPPGNGEFLLRFINLTDAQRDQIRAIHEAEREKIEPFLQQLQTSHEALDKATAKGQFDENTVRSIVNSESQARIELMVAHERTKAAIYN